jgi:hypothetical protein
MYLCSFICQETNRARDLISIPLDIECTRKLLRQALDKTYHSSRSIIECRKMLAFYIYKQEQQSGKDLLVFTPIMDDVERHAEQRLENNEPMSTLHYRPLTAGEPMDFSPTINNRIDTSPTSQVTIDSIIDAYQALASNSPDYDRVFFFH